MIKKQFAVITADIIESKKQIIQNSNENTKSILDKKLYTVNQRIKDLGISTLTPFNSSRGDEIQIVCVELKSIPLLIRYLRYYCLPFKLRIGIGIGDIDYFYSKFINEEVININNWSNYHELKSMLDCYYDRLSSWDMNGTAFYYSRKALDGMNNNSNNTCIFIDNNNYTLAIQTILSLMDLIIFEWSQSNWQSIQMYDEHKTYYKAAEILKITTQAVQKNCKRAKWSIIKQAEDNLSKILSSLDIEL